MAGAINALAPSRAATTSTTATTATTKSADIFGGMGPDAFLKLLVAQLRYQNPMNPSDPTAMMGQVAQFAQVEALTKMQKGQATEQSLSEARMATDMVGKVVSASDGATHETGRVLSARFTATGPVLILDSGAEVTLSAVVSVTERAAAVQANAPNPIAPATQPAAVQPAAVQAPAAVAVPAVDPVSVPRVDPVIDPSTTTP